MRNALFLLLLAGLAWNPIARAQKLSPTPEAGADHKTTPWTVDDIVMQEEAQDFQISPDCRRVVWVKRAPNTDKGRHIANLMLSSLVEKKEITLTRGDENNMNPRWSPDGAHIAFLSSRPLPKGKGGDGDDDAKPQVWLINPQGGEPWNVTEFPRGIAAVEWMNADSLVLAAPEEKTLYENAIKEKKDTSIVVDDEAHAPPVRLFKLDVKTKKFTRLTDNTDRIQSLFVSPNGDKAVTIHERSLRYVYDQQVKPVVFLYDLNTGERKQIFTDNVYNVQQVEWAADGKSFYAASRYTTDPKYVMASVTELHRYDIESGTISKVDLGWERGLEDSFKATEDGFVALLANGARNEFARYVLKQGKWERTFLKGPHVTNTFSFSLGKDGKTLVYDHSTASLPGQRYRAQLGAAEVGEPVQLTELNPHLKTKIYSRSEVIRWKGALDEEVEGILNYPHDYDPSKKYPLVVMIHGGPAGADFDNWSERMSYAPNLMNQRSAFTLRPNYHGSSNYGLKFCESIGKGKYYDLEVPDIEKGVDSLISKGLVDADKLGVLGWSNGGILTIALTTTTTRYKVASSGAGDVEWASDWGNCNFGASFDNYYFGTNPIADPKLYRDKSPFFKLDKVRTPTLIFFGTEDRDVPTQQGWMHYRALQQLTDTDVKFILFPGEQHGPQKLVHRARKLTEELAWFDKYLFKTAKEENEAYKSDSPLAAALKLKDAKRAGTRYGGLENGVLIPETVKVGNLKLGRFEITRAQFAEFDKQYKVEPGTENHPAGNITFEQAKAYCEWLSKTTGGQYRLATDAEIEEIPTSGAVENTLDYWAGYAVNPDDLNRLKAKIAELGGSAKLLKEVGGFKCSDKEGNVFDLGGNVAEWVTDKNGTGKIMGGSADLPVDAKIQPRRPSPECVGFRVVKNPSKASR